MRRLALGRFGTGIGVDTETRIARIEAALGDVELASHVGSVGDLPSTLTDPEADKPLFWSNKKKEFKFLEQGTGISIDTDGEGEGSISLDLTAGTGIAIDGNTISMDLAAGVGIAIDGNEISADPGIGLTVANDSLDVTPNLQAIHNLTFAGDKLIRITKGIVDNDPPVADLIDFNMGLYTPTATHVANIDGSTPVPTMYIRIGPLVGVFGHMNIDPSSGATASELRLSLPIPSNFANVRECVGTASSREYGGVQIEADVATNTAVLNFIAPSGTAASFSFVFWYQIIE